MPPLLKLSAVSLSGIKASLCSVCVGSRIRLSFLKYDLCPAQGAVEEQKYADGLVHAEEKEVRFI